MVYMQHILYLFLLVISKINLSKAQCDSPSLTTVSGTHATKTKICAKDVIFEDDFDTFDLKKWQHEITLAGGGNWEFQYYTNNRSNSYVDGGNLHIRPTYLSNDVGEDFLSSGTLDCNGGAPADLCTNPTNWGCSRTGTASNIVNPIKSARIRTVESFSFKYGTVVVRAKLPSGDWLWPAIWMMPRYNAYSGWPSSGEIDIMESRGNKNFVNTDGTNIGSQQVASTLHWGPFYSVNRFMKTHFEKNNAAGYDTDFHEYKVEWSPNGLSFYVDNELMGTVPAPEGGFWNYGAFENSGLDNPWKGGTNMAPFDQEFYIILNLAVGGTVYFDDYSSNSGGKPWSNKSPTAMTDFWKGKSQWEPTWNLGTDDSHLIIDYVKVYAL